MRPLSVVSAVIAALTPFANSALIHGARLGLNGAALASVALHVIQLAMLAGIAAWHNATCARGAKPWGGFSAEAFKQVRADTRDKGASTKVGASCSLRFCLLLNTYVSCFADELLMLPLSTGPKY